MKNKEAFAALIKQVPNWLDRPIEDLVQMRAVGDVYLTTHRSMLQKIKSGQITLAEEDRKARLKEGQTIGRALLDVEARIGELSYSVPQAQGIKVSGEMGSMPSGEPPKHTKMGLSSKHALLHAQQIARHPEAVAEVIQEAEENEDIPTKTAVLNKIKMKKYTEQNPEPIKTLPSINEVANKVNSKLIDCLGKLREIWKYKDQINQITRDTIVETTDDLYQLIFEENNE